MTQKHKVEVGVLEENFNLRILYETLDRAEISFRMEQEHLTAGIHLNQ
jgi:hypothetical protein